MIKKILKIDKVVLISSAIVLIYVISLCLLRFFKFDYNSEFGYLDHQLYWEALHRLLDGQFIYRDFYWEYGPLYLIYSLPFFVLLGKTFKAYVFIRMVILPLTGFLLSYFVGRELLKGKYLVLFLFVSALYSTLDFTTIRHVVSELGLILVLMGFSKNHQKKILIGSLVMSLSFLAGIEYALIGVVALTIYVVSSFFIKSVKLEIKNILLAYGGIFSIAVLFFGILAIFGALGNYYNFFKEFSTSFLIQSPCRAQYPLVAEFKKASDQGVWFLFTHLRRWNLYFVPLVMFLTLIFLAKRTQKDKNALILLVLLLYSGGSYIRVMVNPCVGIMAYGMMFFVLVLIYLLKTEKIKYKKMLYFLALFILSIYASVSGPMDFAALIGQDLAYKKDQLLLESQKIYLDSTKTKNINKITEYIKQNTTANDYVYVYPYGPYNILSERKSPSSVIISTHFELAPFLVPEIINELEIHKPKIIVLNEINAWSYLASLHQIPNQVINIEGAPVFMAALTDVEKYISQNYEIVEEFEGAKILNRRENPIEYIPAYLKKDVQIISKTNSNLSLISEESSIQNPNTSKFEITGEGPEITYVTGPINDVKLVKLAVRGNKGLFKYSALYLINVFILNLNGNVFRHRTDILSTNWEHVWVYFNGNETLSQSGLVLLKLYKNSGFFDIGGYPRNIEIAEPKFYVFNPLLIEALSNQNQNNQD